MLRWFAEQQSWGCDQCRVMTPAHQLAAAAAPAPARSVSSEMAQLTQLVKPRRAGAPLGNRTPLLIGAGVAGAATLGVVLALVTANSGTADEPSLPLDAAGSAGRAAGSANAGSAASAGSAAAERPITPATVTEGTPELASAGDFWLYPRSDGSMRVASPLFEITFPQRPELTVTRTPASAKSKAIDVYLFVASANANTIRKLELVSTGANSLQNESIAVDIRQKMTKIGTVLENPRSEQGVRIREFEASADAERMRVIHTQDVARGVFLTLTTVAAQGSRDDVANDAIRASFHLRNPKEVVDDEGVLKNVKASKRGKGFLVQDTARSFSIQLPGAVTVTRDADNRVVTVTVGEKKPAAKVTFTFGVVEATSANALMADDSDPSATLSKKYKVPYQRASITMGGMPGYAWQPKGKLPRKTKRVETWMVRDRASHRTYFLTCVGRPCGPIAKTLQLAPTLPSK